jgi:hypothetical protein
MLLSTGSVDAMGQGAFTLGDAASNVGALRWPTVDIGAGAITWALEHEPLNVAIPLPEFVGRPRRPI